MKANFSKIIKDSITITKNNKRLWVFGVVIATLSAGANFGSPGNITKTFNGVGEKNPNNSVQQEFYKNLEESNLLNSGVFLASDTPQVLGTATSTVGQVFQTIPLTFYLILGLLIIVCVVVFTGIAVYAKSWAKASLIQGIKKQDQGEYLGLYQMSNFGKLNAIEVAKIQIIPGAALAVAVSVLAATLGIIFVALGDAGKIVAGGLGIIGVLATIIIALLIGVSIHLGIYAITFESLKWKEAFKRGFEIFKKYFSDVFILSLINMAVGCIVTIVIVTVVGILAGIGAVSVLGVIAFPPFLVATGPIIFLLILAIIMFLGIVGAVMAVFKESTWVLLYKQLTEEVINGQ